jgi:hypothetical protein
MGNIFKLWTACDFSQSQRCRHDDARVISLGEGESEGGASAWLSLGPDFAAVALDDPVGYSQTDPSAREFAFWDQTLERKEELLRVLHIQTDSLVTNAENGRSLSRLLKDGYLATFG